MRPELNLLLRCARVRRDPGTPDQIIALIKQPLDWEYLVRLARCHRLTSLLYVHLQQVCSGDCPEVQLCELRAAYHRTAARNLFLTWQLLELVDRLKAESIPVIPFKGPSLAATLYGNTALRPFDDLDLFVHKSDVPLAQAILRRHGFLALHQLTDAQEATHMKADCERCYVEPQHRVVVDLHWGIAPGYFSVPFEPRDWWDRVSVVTLGDRKVLGLSPEDLLLYLCVHGTKHAWQRLLWVTDVAELVNAYPSLCYETVFDRAGAMHSTRMLLLGLALAKDLLGVELPKSVEIRLSSDKQIPSLVARVTGALGNVQGIGEDMIAISSFRVRSRERLRDRTVYGFKLATTPTRNDWSWVPLPQFLSPLYHVLRPVRLLLQRGLGFGARSAQTTPATQMLPHA